MDCNNLLCERKFNPKALQFVIVSLYYKGVEYDRRNLTYSFVFLTSVFSGYLIISSL